MISRKPTTKKGFTIIYHCKPTYLFSMSSFLLFNGSGTCSTEYICRISYHVEFTKFTFRFWIEYLQVSEGTTSDEHSCITWSGTALWFNWVDWDLEAWPSILSIYLLLFDFIVSLWGRRLHSQSGVVHCLGFYILSASCMGLICTLMARGFLSLDQAWTRYTQ